MQAILPLLRSVVFSCLLLVSPHLFANLSALPQSTVIIPAPPTLAAKAYLLMDYLSDYVIAEQDIDQRVEPASLTKMMGVYVTGHALKSGKVKLGDLVSVSEAAWKTPGSRTFLDVNSTVPVETLLQGIIVQSGNDASVALAEHISGSESAFAELMNFYAKQLGMVNTHFTNATGLPDPNHYTSARDLAILAKALIRDFPDLYALHSQKEFVYQGIKQPNRNRLLWKNPLVDGGKTGHTESAGYCLVASGQKDNMRLIAVVVGTKSDNARMDETNKLLAYGFRFFETRKLYPGEIALKQTRVWMGAEKEVNLGLTQDLYVTIGQGQYDRLKAAINVEKVIKAPATRGTILGTLAIQLDNKTIVERPVVALEEIHPGNLLSRSYDTIALGIHNLLDKIKP
jgi:D-alanyl-D-alanine carboxypeptidase (penicillin-binding protein 5/6)